jgi:hypothetical protein
MKLVLIGFIIQQFLYVQVRGSRFPWEATTDAWWTESATDSPATTELETATTETMETELTTETTDEEILDWADLNAVPTAQSAYPQDSVLKFLYDNYEDLVNTMDKQQVGDKLWSIEQQVVQHLANVKMPEYEDTLDDILDLIDESAQYVENKADALDLDENVSDFVSHHYENGFAEIGEDTLKNFVEENDEEIEKAMQTVQDILGQAIKAIDDEFPENQSDDMFYGDEYEEEREMEGISEWLIIVLSIVGIVLCIVAVSRVYLKIVSNRLPLYEQVEKLKAQHGAENKIVQKADTQCLV